ncbi:MAG: cyclase family protein [Candidatus Margulisiibacteriota bacterium]|jgi:kynurenine formamidase
MNLEMDKRKKQRIINLGGVKFKLIDLTEPLNENFEVFPGDPKPQKEVFCTFAKENCQYNIYSLGDHNFHPHGDAPNHQNPEYIDRGFEFWSLDFVFNQACMLDFSNAKEAKDHNGITFITKITAKHLKPYLNQIKNSQALIIRTGYDNWLKVNRPHLPSEIPYLDISAADFLANFRKLKVIGTDSLTVDAVGQNYTHQKLKDKLLVECLVNLDLIPKKYRKCFSLQTSPIAVVGATGGPILAYAYVFHGVDPKVKKIKFFKF